MKEIRAEIDFDVSARGWCYLLEQHKVITKAHFDTAQRIITEERKKDRELLYMVLEDSGRPLTDYSGFDEGVDHETAEEYAKWKLDVSVDNIRWNLVEVNRVNCSGYSPADYWEFQSEFPVMMVEKIDLYNLFEPVCRKYRVPLTNAKGWSYLLQRAKIVELFQEAEEKGLIPVILYAGDFDPAGLNIWDLEEIHRVMDQLIHGHRYAQCTIDLAIHDFLGKAAGIPVWRLLGGRIREKIFVTAPHLGYLSPDEMAIEAEQYVKQGYKFINLRAGRDLQEDLAILASIREKVGPDIPIDMDFSQSLSLHQRRPDDAIRYIRQLEKYGINSFEQPLAAPDLKGMKSICAAVETPVFADEAVFEFEDILRIADSAACVAP
jgi:hypothetical protein